MAKSPGLGYDPVNAGELAVGKQTIKLAWRALGALTFMACATHAQVMEIRADGTSVTYAGPVVMTAEGERLLAPSIPLTPSHARAAGASTIATLRQAATRHDMSPSLVEAVAWQESRWNQGAVSRKGARGIMQLMPATARSLGVDARDLSGNVDGGAAYLAQMMQRFNGDILRSLAAYNAGPEAVARYGGVPPYRETQAFVSSILDRLAASAMSPEVQR
jgi:soluble lytic murein transglycosylase-like protein